MKTFGQPKPPKILTIRQLPTGGKLNGSNQPVVTTAPAIRVNNTRKG